MKTFLILLAIDALTSAAFVVLFFALRRRCQGTNPFQVTTRQWIELVTKATPLIARKPRWAVAQGLTLFEELEVHRKYRDVLARECGTDDICILIEAMDRYDKMQHHLWR